MDANMLIEDVTRKHWHHRYLGLAREVASWSKDPSRKIGAIAVGSKGQVLAQGYNGFPRGISDDEIRLNDRELKYKFVVHAEMNLIYNATYNGVSLDGSTVYVTGLPVCSECAKGLIQVGVKRVVMAKLDETPPMWKESFDFTTKLFDEAKVQWMIIDETTDSGSESVSG
jgi:dCMP deaminase